MIDKIKVILILIVIINFPYISLEEVSAEKIDNDLNKELVEYRLNIIEEDLKEKVDKDTLENEVIKTLEIEREAIISDRDFYQNIFTYTISIIGIVFTLFSMVNIYRIFSTRNVIKESKDAKKEIVEIKNEVNSLVNEVKEANKALITERDQIVNELVEEKQKIKDRIEKFNITMGSLEESLKNYEIHKDDKELLNEVEDHVKMLEEVAAEKLDPNIEKVEAGKLKDKEIGAIEISEDEI